MAGPTDTTEAPSEMESLRDGIKNLHVSTEYSDFILKLGTREWKVHKAVVCSQSSVFKAACKSQWLVENSVVELHDETETVVDQMIRFLYLSTYDDRAGTSSGQDPIQFNLRMFIAADKFDIPHLCDLARKNFTAALDALADEQDFIDTIRVLYKEASPSLTDIREHVVTIAMFKCKIPLNMETESATGKKIHLLIEDIPSFGVELVVRLTAQVEKLYMNFDIREKALQRKETIFSMREDNCALRETSVENITRSGRERQDAIDEQYYELQQQRKDFERQKKYLRKEQKQLSQRQREIAQEDQEVSQKQKDVRQQKEAFDKQKGELEQLRKSNEAKASDLQERENLHDKNVAEFALKQPESTESRKIFLKREIDVWERETVIEKRKKELEEKDQDLEQKQRALEQKEQELEEREKELELKEEDGSDAKLLRCPECDCRFVTRFAIFFKLRSLDCPYCKVPTKPVVG